MQKRFTGGAPGYPRQDPLDGDTQQVSVEPRARGTAQLQATLRNVSPSGFSAGKSSDKDWARCFWGGYLLRPTPCGKVKGILERVHFPDLGGFTR
jgi:hypothetical protein